MCGCNAEIEDTEHFLLRFHFYSIERFKLFSNVNKVDLTQLDTKKNKSIFCCTVIHPTNLIPESRYYQVCS